MPRTKSDDNLDFTRVADLVLSIASNKVSLLVKSQQLGRDFRDDDGFVNQELSGLNQGAFLRNVGRSTQSLP